MKSQFKTLAQARKAYSDATEFRTKHTPYAFTEADYIDIIEDLTDNQYRIIFCKVGRCTSSVIASKAAKVEYEAKFSKWLETQPKTNMTIETLRKIFDAMDDEDK